MPADVALIIGSKEILARARRKAAGIQHLARALRLHEGEHAAVGMIVKRSLGKRAVPFQNGRSLDARVSAVMTGPG